MFAQPAKFNRALHALQEENRSLRELTTLQQMQLDEINAALKK